MIYICNFSFTWLASCLYSVVRTRRDVSRSSHFALVQLNPTNQPYLIFAQPFHFQIPRRVISTFIVSDLEQPCLHAIWFHLTSQSLIINSLEWLWWIISQFRISLIIWLIDFDYFIFVRYCCLVVFWWDFPNLINMA